MNTRMYWSIQHARQAMHEIRFKLNCWWLSQQVGFLEWQLGHDALVPQPQPVPVRMFSR